MKSPGPRRAIQGTRTRAVKALAVSLTALALVAGCSSAARKTVYLPDGRAALMASCDDDGWQKCYKKATKTCKHHSYEALEKQRNPKVLYYSCRAT